MSVRNFVSNYLSSVKTVDILTLLVFLLSAECKKNFDNVVTVKKTYQSYLDFCSLSDKLFIHYKLSPFNSISY